jgi:hypothetical protein
MAVGCVHADKSEHQSKDTVSLTHDKQHAFSSYRDGEHILQLPGSEAWTRSGRLWRGVKKFILSKRGKRLQTAVTLAGLSFIKMSPSVDIPELVVW